MLVGVIAAVLALTGNLVKFGVAVPQGNEIVLFVLEFLGSLGIGLGTNQGTHSLTKKS